MSTEVINDAFTCSIATHRTIRFVDLRKPPHVDERETVFVHERDNRSRFHYERQEGRWRLKGRRLAIVNIIIAQLGCEKQATTLRLIVHAQV